MSDSKDLITLEKNLLEKEEKIEKEREALEKEKEQFSKVKDEYREELSKVSSLTVEEARKQLLEEVEEREAQAILVDSMRHGAINYIPEFTLSTVKIPDEDIKGRIIGKEGTNIRAFEQATGVDVDLDEEGVIRLS